MRTFLLISVLAAGPVWADEVTSAPEQTVQTPSCDSCTARKSGLKKLKAARDAKLTAPQPADG